MSVSLLSYVEVFDSDKGEWIDGNLYYKPIPNSRDYDYDEENEEPKDDYKRIYLLPGGRAMGNALFGDSQFDYLEETGDIDDFSAPSARLERYYDLEAKIWDAQGVFRPDNVKGFDPSQRMIDAMKLEENTAYVTYTLRDLREIRLLAETVSSRALRFYEWYFGKIESMLRLIADAYSPFSIDRMDDRLRITIIRV